MKRQTLSCLLAVGLGGLGGGGTFGCADSAPTDEGKATDAGNGQSGGALSGAAPMPEMGVDSPGEGANGAGGAGGTSGPATCPAVEELCNGIDDTCDGVVDEGCACLGSSDCYGGPAGTRGVGACQDGARACDDVGEFWQDCQFFNGPVVEVCDDAIDNDCDGTADEDCGGPPPPPPPPPGDEVCANGVDDDGDGQVDEDCGLCSAEVCGDGIDNDCDNRIDEDCLGPCIEREICNDAVDNDCDGVIDDECEDDCPPGVQRACFPGPPAFVGVGICRAGQQLCVAGPAWGPCDGAVMAGDEDLCDNGLDDNCDGRIDEGCRECVEEVCDNGVDDDCDGGIDEECGCQPAPEVCANGADEDCDGVDPACGPIEVPILLIGDCLTASCPAHAPHPVGCHVFFSPGDERGCVANTPGSSVVYFQAGDECNRGLVTGTLLCSDQPGPPLSAANCPINKPQPIYADDRDGCPETD